MSTGTSALWPTSPTEPEPPTPSSTRKRRLQEGKQARVKCDNCRDDHLLCAPPKRAPSPSGCDTCKGRGKACGGYTIKTRSVKRPRGRQPAPRTPEPSVLASPVHPHSSAHTRKTGVSQDDISDVEEYRFLADTPSKAPATSSARMDQDWDYYKDLIDAVSLFVLCRIKSETLSRQYRRLRHILGSPPNPPLFPSSLDKFRSSLEVTVRTKRDRVSRTSTENLILSQAISLLDNESAGPEAEYDPLSAMMKAGFLGSEFMVLLHKLASFERGSPWSAQDVEQLKQLGKSLYGAVNRIDDRFGVIPYPGGEFFDETSLLMPTVLICGLRDSQFGSQSFIDLSFLWNWMAFASPGGPADLPTGLFREKDIQVLIETVVASEQWDLNRQESHHDHTFWHVVLLARRPGDSQVIHYDGKPILTTKWGKNILHYAAATGVKLEVKASGGWAGSRD